jgi:hypothetical protein
VAAVLPGDGEAAGVLGQADDGDFGSAESGHGGAEDADGARAEHEDAVAGFDAGVADDGVVGDAAGFGEAGLFERELVRDVVQNAGGNPDVACHGSVDSVAESLAGGIEIVESPAGHGIIRADDGRGFRDDAVAFLPVVHAAAGAGDDAAEFVSEDHGVVDRP